MLDAFDKENTLWWAPDLFGAGAKDPVWVPKAAAMNPKPVIVSGDGAQLKNAVEARNLKAGNLTFVHLAPGWTNTAWHDYAWKIVKAWPGVVEAVSYARQPTIFELSVSGLKTKRKFFTNQL